MTINGMENLEFIRLILILFYFVGFENTGTDYLILTDTDTGYTDTDYTDTD